MKKPENATEFYNLIKSMEHRERFVFRTNLDELEQYAIEVYTTDIDGSRGLEKNVNFQYVSSTGKHESNTIKRSILFKYITIDWLGKLLNVLK
jgi:hypothetical protein